MINTDFYNAKLLSLENYVDKSLLFSFLIIHIGLLRCVVIITIIAAVAVAVALFSFCWQEK